MHRVSEPNIERTLFHEFTEDGFLSLAQSEENLARWLSDHFKSKEEQPQLTQRNIAFSYAMIATCADDLKQI